MDISEQTAAILQRSQLNMMVRIAGCILGFKIGNKSNLCIFWYMNRDWYVEQN